jgi:hypothetical protein
MTANILTALLFYAGYLGMRTHWQALVFLAIGAGYQWVIYAVTDPRPPELWAATLIISLASAMGYVAWRSANRWPEDGLLSRRRLMIFAGFAVNWALAIWLLKLSGQI